MTVQPGPAAMVSRWRGHPGRTAWPAWS